MTVAHGFGLLALGMTVILVGGLIVLKVINMTQENERRTREDKELKERKPWIL